MIQLVQAERSYGAPQPVGGNVLVARHQADLVFAGTTFVIPDIAKEKPNTGVVLSVGPDAAEKHVCKPGDVVRFSLYSAEDFEIDGETVTLIDYRDIKYVQPVTFVASVN